jgi:hypothetical protein
MHIFNTELTMKNSVIAIAFPINNAGPCAGFDPQFYTANSTVRFFMGYYGIKSMHLGYSWDRKIPCNNTYYQVTEVFFCIFR